MNRPLSPMEHVVWLVDQVVSLNFVMIARISGALSEPVLRRALDMVQEKHPALKCKFKRGDVPGFVSQDVPKIPLRIIERKDENHWQEVAEKEMSQQFPWTEGPLVRVVQLTSRDKSDLLVTFCHIIADGISGVNVAHHLLKIAGKLSRGETIETEPPLPELPTPLDLIRKDLKFPPEFLDIFGRIRQTFHKPVELPGEDDTPPEKRRTRVIQRVLSQTETQKLAARSKQEKTSVHGALSAAALQAVVEQVRRAPGIRKKGALTIGCFSPVNMRRYFSNSIVEDVGNFNSFAIHYQSIDENASIWPEARKIKKSLERELKFGRDIKSTRNVGDPAKTNVTPIDMARNLNKTFPPVMITNMGRLNIPEQFGNLELAELHFVVSINPHVKNGFALVIYTFRGHLTINFLYSEPYISRERANTMVESTMKRLKDAIR